VPKGVVMPFDIAGGRKRILLLVPDIADTITHNRVEAFRSVGHELVVAGFRRGRYKRADPPGGPHICLGRTADARYGHRFAAIFGALPRLLARRKTLRPADAIYARNIDQLVLALFCRFVLFVRAPIFYEVLDIQPIFVGNGMVSHLVRLIERLCLRQIRLLIVSSGGFHSNFYLPVQRYQGRWFLLENKLPASVRAVASDRTAPAKTRQPLSGPITVGYFGLIRGDATLDLIERLAKKLGDRALFRFAGIITSVDPTRFRHVVETNPNILYEGQYANPADLPRLYGSVDFAWALDLEHIEGNSRWLMPCRFYEAGYFGVPCLAAKGFEVGRAIEELDCGWTFAEPYEKALLDFFRSVTAEDYARKRQRLFALPDSTYIAATAADGLASILR
jgi:succinoglycan biosynthesis protein ExoL